MRVDFGKRMSGRVVGLMSARPGGVSATPYDSCNLGDHVKDDPAALARNRATFAEALAASPAWLTQVHGNRLVRLSRQPGSVWGGMPCVDPDADMPQTQADGAITTEPGLACSVMVADCLPVLLAAPEGRGVAALHAGWRGLAGEGAMQGLGILHTGVQALCELTGADPADLCAWLGPCIGPLHFEVGADVLAGFGVDPADASHTGHAARHLRFKPLAAAHLSATTNDKSLPKWLADLPGLGRDTLLALGVREVSGGQLCTVSDASRFFSFRRDGVTGRQAAAIHIL
jgi:YfiH family protein